MQVSYQGRRCDRFVLESRNEVGTVRPIEQLLAAAVVAIAGCGSAIESADPAELAEVTGVHQCTAAKDPARPMLVEWPATEKATLQSAAGRGLVVVRYDGCRLKLLDGCAAGGGYEFTETSRSRDGLSVRDKGELFARLPLGAVSLEAELGGEHVLELAYVAVGTRTADAESVARERLSGSCEGATHFVRGMVVGAYELARASASQVGAGAEVGSAGLGGSHESSRQVIRSDGNLEACLDDGVAAADTRCQAVVQLVLEPLQDTAANTPVAPEKPMYGAPTEPKPLTDAYDVKISRCQAGRTWTGIKCDGMPVRVTWDEAQTVCPVGWRTASREELVTLLDDCDPAVEREGKGDCKPCKHSAGCNALYGAGSIAWGQFWTSTPFGDKSAYYVSFKQGQVRYTYKNNHMEVLCARPRGGPQQ
jgi:hypothetical protein